MNEVGAVTLGCRCSAVVCATLLDRVAVTPPLWRLTCCALWLLSVRQSVPMYVRSTCADTPLMRDRAGALTLLRTVHCAPPAAL